jgi:hypothetical protein
VFKKNRLSKKFSITFFLKDQKILRLKKINIL